MIKIILIFIFYFYSLNAQAFDFVPSEPEFLSWDRKCQAIYAGTSVGKAQAFTMRISADERANAVVMAQSNGGAWHYCASLIYFNRGMKKTSKEKATKEFEYGLKEILFTATRIDKRSSWYPEIALKLGEFYIKLGEKNKGLKVIKEIASYSPLYPPAYTAQAYFHNKLGDIDKAILVLEQAPSEIKDSSAELNYFLGLFYFKKEDYEKAELYSSKAYALGYPLQGLKNNLDNLKHN